MFYRRSINEYRRQISLKESFAIQTERLRETFDSAEESDFDGLFADRSELSRRLRLLLLSPLVEIAWADGRVTRGESNAIFEVAETYGLFQDDAQYCALLENLTSRPAPQTVGRMWQDFIVCLNIWLNRSAKTSRFVSKFKPDTSPNKARII
jgi:hypothetical protein